MTRVDASAYGSPQNGELLHHKQHKSRSNCTCALWILLVVILLLGEALMVFFLIPRDPCVFMKSGSGDVGAFQASPLHFTADVDVTLTWGNPSYVSVGFDALHLDVYHACCVAPVATITQPTGVDVAARDSKDVVITMSLDSNNMSNITPCATELLINNRCLLTFKGTTVPIYQGYALPTVNVEFQQYLTR